MPHKRTTITVDEFKEGLRSLKGTIILTIVAHVAPAMRRANNPYMGRVVKHVIATGTIGADYELARRRAQIAAGDEGDFEEGPRAWGKYIDSCFVEHGTHLYLRFIERSRHETYYLDDKPTDPAFLADFMPPRAAKEEPVKYRNFDIANIVSITWGRHTYEISRPENVSAESD